MKASTPTFILLSTLLIACSTKATSAQSVDPAIVNWIINTTGSTGSSVDADMNELVSEILADVEAVHYTDDAVYVTTSGVPSYSVGPFPDGNPAYASDVDAIYLIPRKPVAAPDGANEAVGLGTQGIFVNGVAVYNFGDGMSYNNQGIWNQDANVFEFGGFDAAIGHPSPIRNEGGGGGPGGGGPGGGGPGGGGPGGGGPGDDGHGDDGHGDGGHGDDAGSTAGYYHHHQNPVFLRQQLGDDGSQHSPIIGFAFDGFPIYGPYGFDDPTESSSEIVRIESSFRLRDITERTTLADGTELAPALHGPTLEEIALGSYHEDYEFVAGLGHVDIHNGRFTVTPDYPDGTYAYFITLGQDGSSAFPHMLGSTFYGELASQREISIPDGATAYIVPEPSAYGILGGGAIMAISMSRRRRRRAKWPAA